MVGYSQHESSWLIVFGGVQKDVVNTVSIYDISNVFFVDGNLRLDTGNWTNPPEGDIKPASVYKHAMFLWNDYLVSFGGKKSEFEHERNFWFLDLSELLSS